MVVEGRDVLVIAEAVFDLELPEDGDELLEAQLPGGRLVLLLALEVLENVGFVADLAHRSVRSLVVILRKEEETV